MIQVSVTNTETNISVSRNYTQDFFQNNQAERLGQEFYEMAEAVKEESWYKKKEDN